MKANFHTVYAGERVQTEHGGFTRFVRVTVDGQPLVLPRQWRIGSGYEWGYSGAGPARLALAIVLHATGDPELACRTYRWFMLLKVYCWGSTWRITAGEVVALVEEFDRDKSDAEADDERADQAFIRRGERLRADGPHAPPEANFDDWLRRMFDERGGEL